MRKLLSLILFSLAFESSVAYAAVALDATIKAIDGSSSTTLSTGSITVAGSNLVGWAFVGSRKSGGANDPTGVTWNGIAMTQAANVGQNGQSNSSAWYIIAPTTGVITATWGSAQDFRSIFAHSYTGARQSTQPDATATQQSSNAASGDKTLGINTVENGSMVVSAVTYKYADPVASSPYTNRLTDTTLMDFQGSTADHLVASASSDTVTWVGLWEFDEYDMISLSIAPFSTSSTQIKSVSGVAQAQIKSVDAVAVGQAKSVEGVSNV